mmetsp:Transcript_12246/g.22156  ORF Transcript_12246/g.22156 Transcript_12246/m.22156 type:complete len:559 (+) Transcript_12246:50-1726(+)
MADAEEDVLIIHFNDVYNVEEGSREPVGGAARFTAKVREFERMRQREGKSKPLILFSGDAFSPSMMSTVVKGKQMIPIFNALPVHYSCVGNHDLDHGVEAFTELISETQCPWILSNVRWKDSGKVLDDVLEYVVFEWGSFKIGLMGLAESEWISTLASIEPEELEYEDFVDCARRLEPQLRADGADFVIALTHMRVPNDLRLAEEYGDHLDLILGGHDHHYDARAIPPHDTYVFKSGTDFQTFTTCKMRRGDPRGSKCSQVTDVVRCDITRDVPVDGQVQLIVKSFEDVVGKEMEKWLGDTSVDLDARFTSVRTQETNIGNWLMDVLRQGLTPQPDVAFINSGTLRADCIYEAGAFRMKDLVRLLPMMDETVVIEIKGDVLLQAMENGVSMYPKLEGRFPQVSGISFAFDPTKEPMNRIDPTSVYVREEPLDFNKDYTVITKDYLRQGKDGYECLMDRKVVVDAESAPMLPTLIRSYFLRMKVLNSMKTYAAVLPGNSDYSKFATQWKERALGSHRAPKDEVYQLRKLPSCVSFSADQPFTIAPKLESRIVCLNPIDQ